jgi:hypothetical protein
LRCASFISGVPQIVLLTKIDKVCPITEEDMSQVFYSPIIKEAVDSVSWLGFLLNKTGLNTVFSMQQRLM